MALADDELTRAIFAMASQMYGARSVGQGLSRGGMFAMNSVDNLREQKARQSLVDAKLREESQQFDQRALALKQQQAWDDAMTRLSGGAGTTPQGPPMPTMQQGDYETPSGPPMQRPAPQQVPPQVAQANRDAILSEMAFRFPDKVKAIYEAQRAGQGKVYGEPQKDSSGRVFVNTDNGPRYIDGGFVPRDELVETDIGGKKVFRTKYDPAPVAYADKTMTPGERDVSARGWADFNRGQYDTTRGGFVNTKGFIGVPNLPGGTGAREDLDKLRMEFNGLHEVKTYKEVVPVFNAAAKAPNTNAGDFALIYGVGKVMDPGSVVREGEMNMVIAAGSPAQRVAGYLSALQDKGRLTPSQRGELQDMLRTAVSEHQAVYNQARERYGAVAAKRGYDPADIFIDAPNLSSSQRVTDRSLVGAIGGGKKSGAEIEADILAEIDRKRRK